MTARDDPLRPKPVPKPPILRGSPEWRASECSRQRAYAEQRRRYADTWHRRLAGLEDEPEPAAAALAPDSAPPVADPAPPQPSGQRRSSRARGRIHDPKQGSFEV